MFSVSSVAARVAAVVLLASTVGLAACSSSQPSTSTSTSASAGIRGDQLPRPITLSAADRAAQFRTSDATTTTLAALQQGRLMLVYFGYTHCPDVCPTTMADLGSALRQQPSIVQAHTQVVFITADPARDTPTVMKSWLANFDPGLLRPFIGLTASVHQIDTVAKSMGVPLEPPVTEPNGSVSVTHGAQTIAFVGDRAKVLWLSGTTPADYAHDIGLLVQRVGNA